MTTKTFTAFVADRRIASGPLPELLAGTKDHLDAHPSDLVLIFEDQSGLQVDFDFHGSRDEVLARYAPPPPPHRGPGRPRLGVVSREVSLLPRHWEWLESQPNGTSAALRRVIDEANRRAPRSNVTRRVRESMSRFMTAMAGDRPGYEEAARALFAGDGAAFESRIVEWPTDIVAHLMSFRDAAFPESAARPQSAR